ncbi:hypothetical protein BG004_004925 [Podila humilis]|nr:hypothetical protein BG004_004925 [Podila humilis]
MNSNTESWASIVAGNTQDSHSHIGRGRGVSHESHRPEMSSSDTLSGKPAHYQHRQQQQHHHQATPMRHRTQHAGHSEYHVEGQDFHGSQPKMPSQQPILLVDNNTVNENENLIIGLQRPLEQRVKVKVRGPMAIFSSMGGKRSTPTTVIDLDDDTTGSHSSAGHHAPYHAHPILFESGDMLVGLSRALFGPASDDTKDISSIGQQVDRQDNDGSPAMDIGQFFQEPTTSSSSRPKGSGLHKHQHHHNHHHHHRHHHQVEPPNAPAHHTHGSSRQESHPYRDNNNHQPIHGGSRHAQQESQPAAYRHPTQHRAVHRPHNAVPGTPEMHLDTLFIEPTWYSGDSSKSNKKDDKKAAKKAAKNAAKKANKKNLSQTSAHGTETHDNTVPVHQNDQDTSHAQYPFSHHDVYMFTAPSKHESSHLTADSPSSQNRLHTSGEAAAHGTGTSHLHDATAKHNRSLQGHQEPSDDIDASRGGLYKRPTQHRAVRRPHNASIGTPEMHLDAIFLECGSFPIRSAPHSFSHDAAAEEEEDDDYELNYQHILGHHWDEQMPRTSSHGTDLYSKASATGGLGGNKGAPSRHRKSSTAEHDDHNEEGYYMNHQPIRGHGQHHDLSSFGAAPQSQSTQKRAVHKPRAAAPASTATAKNKKQKASQGQHGKAQAHREPSNAPDNDDYGHHNDHHNEEGYYMNHQPIHGNTQQQQQQNHRDTSRGAVYKRPTQHRPVKRHHNAPPGTPEMHLDDVFKEPAWYGSISDTSSSGKSKKKAAKPQRSTDQAHHDEAATATATAAVQSTSSPLHTSVKKQKSKAGEGREREGGEGNDSTEWNLGSLFDDTKPDRRRSSLPSKFAPAAKSSSSHGGAKATSGPSSTSAAAKHQEEEEQQQQQHKQQHKTMPLTVQQLSRVAVPVGQKVTFTTVTRTTVTLMGVPSDFVTHEMQHLQSEDDNNVKTDFSGPVSRAGQTSIWVRKVVTKESFEGDHVICQNCHNPMSRL